jgi:uncharacterized membrane protein YgdD (TMEM256/DUF423 family)
MSTTDDKRIENARRLFASGAVLAASGLALCGTVSKPIGGVVVLAGWAALTAAIHTYGRLGEG